MRIFDLTYSEEFRRKFAEGCEKIFDEAYLTTHSFVREFEEKFAKYNNSNYAVAVNCGTGALECAFKAIGVRGKKVLMPSNTFIADAIAARNAGAEPIFLDIEEEYYSLCPDKLKQALEKYGEEVGAVVQTHIGGHVAPSVLINAELCKNKNIPLVEDCAHVPGAKVNETNAGNFGDYGCFSFFMTKVMTTGEGGMIVTQTQENCDKLKSLRQFGADLNYKISHIREGNNFKLSEFQALCGILELERIEERINKRRQIAQKYQELLKDTSFKTLKDRDSVYGTYYKQTIVSTKIPREKIEKAFEENNIAMTGGVYYIPLHRQPVFIGKFKDDEFPITNEFAENHFCPPCYPELKLSDVDRICDVLKSLEKNQGVEIESPEINEEKTKDYFSKITYLMIEPNSTCNLHCHFCTREYLEEKGWREPKILSVEEFRKIVELFKDCKIDTVKLHGLSEPFLHPQLSECAKVIREYFPEAFIITSSNLQYNILNSEFFKTLQYVDLIYLSIDGIGEMYEKIKTGGKFDRLIESLENIKRFISPEDRKKKLQISTVISRENYKELPKIYELKEKYGIGSVRINLAQNWDEGQLNKWEVDEEVLEYLKQYKKDVKGVPVWDYKDCFWPYSGIVIDAAGNVRQCILNTTQKPIGNIFQEDIKKIFNEKMHYLELREKLGKNIAPDACKTCDYKFLTKYLQKIFEEEATIKRPRGSRKL